MESTDRDVLVIPKAGTLLVDGSAIRRVLGTLIIDDETAILHTDDGPAVVLADDPRSLAFVKAQAGLEDGS